MLHLPFQKSADRLNGHPLQALAGESEDHQAAGGRLVDPAGPQVEDAVVVELPDGRPVRALDVVGVDLELRLGIWGC